MGTGITTERIEVWTFLILGGPSLGYQKPLSPPLEHRGGRTLWKMTGTAAQADQVRKVLESHGCQVEVSSSTRISKGCGSAGTDQYQFATPLCPTCAFWDPDTEGECGLIGWTLEAQESLLELETAQKDRAACPKEY